MRFFGGTCMLVNMYIVVNMN